MGGEWNVAHLGVLLVRFGLGLDLATGVGVQPLGVTVAAHPWQRINLCARQLNWRLFVCSGARDGVRGNLSL